MTNAANEYAKLLAKRLKGERGNKCEVQGCNRRNLEWAHIHRTPISGKHRGRKEKLYDILKHPKCYRLLCHYHHFHLKKLKKQHSRIMKEAKK